MLRGSRDFASRRGLRRFSAGRCSRQRNAGRQERLAEEMALLRAAAGVRHERLPSVCACGWIRAA